MSLKHHFYSEGNKNYIYYFRQIQVNNARLERHRCGAERPAQVKKKSLEKTKLKENQIWQTKLWSDSKVNFPSFLVGYLGINEIKKN